MRRFISLLATLGMAGLGCGEHPQGDLETTQPQGQPTVTAAVAEDCHPVTRIEIVHRVNGSAVTDRLRLTDDAAATASLALRSFQVAADHFGADNIVSSRPITQVECFAPQIAAGRRLAAVDPPTNATVCVDWNGVQDCTQVVPSHTYDYAGTETCSVTNYTDATSVSCEDSSAIVTRHGDVVLTINTQALRDDIAARTQVLRRLVGDGNVVTNIHFDIVLTPDQQAAIVGNDAYASIAQQIKQASDAGQPLPDIGQLLHNLPQPPQNVDFYAQLLKAYQTKIERLNMLAQITNGRLLTAQQVNAFYQNFVGKSKLIDKLTVNHSPAALSQAASQINDTISQLANNDPVSTIYEQVKAGGQSLLAAHTSSGVFDPDNVIDFVVPNLYQSVTDDDIDKRLISSDLLKDINQQVQRSDGRQRAHDMNGPLRMLTPAMQSGDMDTAWRLWDQTKATEFFFDHTVPTGTSFDVHLTPQAQAMFNITVEPSSSRAYEVINLLNEAADFHAATGKVTVDFQAIITLNARSALATGDLYRALYHTEESYGVLNFLRSVGGAIVATALSELAVDAVGIIDVIGALGWQGTEAVLHHLTAGLANWRQVQDLVLQLGGDIIHRWPGMTPAEKAALVAQIAGQIIQTLPSQALEAGALAAALDAAVRAHLDLAARGLAIIERAGVQLSEPAAVELIKQLDAEGITALDEAIQVADALDNALPCNLVGSVTGALRRASASGPKPPCTTEEIRAAFEKFRAVAKDFGFTDPDDIKDLMTSSEHTPGLPGRVIENAMDSEEISFADKIVEREGGVFVGNRVHDRPAIDGFYRGQPVQLKAGPTDSVVKAVAKVGKAWERAKGYSGLRVYVRAEKFTASAIREQIEGMFIPQYMDGRLTSAHFLTADGWIDVTSSGIQD